MTILLPNARRFVRLADLAQRIIHSDASWETKFDLIFSDAIRGEVKATCIPFDWNNPDTSYEDDVRAYVAALVRKADDLRLILLKVDTVA